MLGFYAICNDRSGLSGISMNHYLLTYLLTYLREKNMHTFYSYMVIPVRMPEGINKMQSTCLINELNMSVSSSLTETVNATLL